MLYIYSWNRLLCGGLHAPSRCVAEGAFYHWPQAGDRLRETLRLARKAQTPSGGRHALRSTCNALLGAATLFNCTRFAGGRVTHERHGFVLAIICFHIGIKPIL